MKKLLVPALWLALVVTIAYSVKEAVRAIRETVQFEQDTTRLFTQVELDRIVRDSSHAFQSRADSAAKRLTGIAERQSRSILQLKDSTQRLRGALDSATNASDSLQIAITALETYRVALDTAQSVIDGYKSIVALRDSQIVKLSRSERLGWQNVDSLQSLIRRVPGRCKVMGLVPCPALVAGYGVTSQGLGPFAGLAIPLH